MKFLEAMKALEEGKIVRMKEWGEDKCIFLDHLKQIILMGAASQQIFECFTQEWEIYKSPRPTLSFSEVVKGLKEGKKFKRPNWLNYSIWLGETWRGLGITDGEGEYWINIEDFEATDWGEVE